MLGRVLAIHVRPLPLPLGYFVFLVSKRTLLGTDSRAQFLAVVEHRFIPARVRYLVTNCGKPIVSRSGRLHAKTDFWRSCRSGCH